jgi:hypothetical protein
VGDKTIGVNERVPQLLVMLATGIAKTPPEPEAGVQDMDFWSLDIAK